MLARERFSTKGTYPALGMSVMEAKKASEEFTREAVALASQPGVTKSQVRRGLGVNPNLLTR